MGSRWPVSGRFALWAGPLDRLLLGGRDLSFGLRAIPVPTAPLPDWGRSSQAAEDWSATGEVQTLQPTRPLPPPGANGELSGYDKGWQGSIHTVVVSPTYNSEINQTALGSFFVEGLTGDLTQIVPKGPPNTKFIGSGHGFFVVRTPGLYAPSIRFERPPGPTADCLIRLYFGPRRSRFQLLDIQPGGHVKDI